MGNKVRSERKDLNNIPCITFYNCVTCIYCACLRQSSILGTFLWVSVQWAFSRYENESHNKRKCLLYAPSEKNFFFQNSIFHVKIVKFLKIVENELFETNVRSVTVWMKLLKKLPACKIVCLPCSIIVLSKIS